MRRLWRLLDWLLGDTGREAVGLLVSPKRLVEDLAGFLWEREV